MYFDLLERQFRRKEVYLNMVVSKVYSAGGIVYRLHSEQIEIVLCSRLKSGIWVLPKGSPLPGETISATAVREVVEETGLLVAIEKKVGFIKYRFEDPLEGIIYDKKVHFFLMIETGGSLDNHDHEFDLVAWFSLPVAVSRMTYTNEILIVQKAIDLLKG